MFNNRDIYSYIYILGIHLCVERAITNIGSRLQVRTRRDTFRDAIQVG